MKLKMFFLILLFLSYSSAEDVYPFFSDVKKQLKFEEKKLFIEEINEKEMVIGGGAQFNLLFLLDSSQPLTIPDNITTTYRYIDEFNIYQGNTIIDEFKFCEIIGLNEIAEEIRIEYINKLNNYQPEIIEIKGTSSPALKFFGIFSLIGGGFLGGTGIIFIADPAPAPLWITSGALLFIGYKLYKKGNTIYTTSDFIMDRRFSNKQIIDLSESYNRKLYNELKSEP